MLKSFSFILVLFAFAACQNQLPQDVLPVFDLTKPLTSDILRLSDLYVFDRFYWDKTKSYPSKKPGLVLLFHQMK